MFGKRAFYAFNDLGGKGFHHPVKIIPQGGQRGINVLAYQHIVGTDNRNILRRCQPIPPQRVNHSERGNIIAADNRPPRKLLYVFKIDKTAN
jgi:hypothetical protein